MNTWLSISDRGKKKLDKLNNLIRMIISIQLPFNKTGRLKMWDTGIPVDFTYLCEEPAKMRC